MSKPVPKKTVRKSVKKSVKPQPKFKPTQDQLDRLSDLCYATVSHFLNPACKILDPKVEHDGTQVVQFALAAMDLQVDLFFRSTKVKTKK